MIEGEKRDFMKSKILVYILNSDNISCDKRRTTYNPVSVTVNSTPFNSSSPSRTVNLSQSNDTMSAFNHFSQQNLFIILFFLISRLFLNLVFLLLQVLHLSRLHLCKFCSYCCFHTCHCCFCVFLTLLRI